MPGTQKSRDVDVRGLPGHQRARTHRNHLFSLKAPTAPPHTKNGKKRIDLLKSVSAGAVVVVVAVVEAAVAAAAAATTSAVVAAALAAAAVS